MDPIEARVREVFGKAPFVSHLGVQLVEVGDSYVVSTLRVSEHMRQQHGFAHAGVVTTLADHTAGAAASTVIEPDQSVLTAEFGIHLLRPASDESLRCRGEIIKAGRTLIVTQADVWSGRDLCARYTGSMAVVERAI